MQAQGLALAHRWQTGAERIRQSCPALDQNSDLYTPLGFKHQMWHVLEDMTLGKAALCS